MFISSLKRVPFAECGSVYSQISAKKLCSDLVGGVLEDSHISPQGFALGCAMQGQKYNLPKQILNAANAPEHIHTVMLNKSCGSGIAALLYAFKYLYFNDSVRTFLYAAVENAKDSDFELDDARNAANDSVVSDSSVVDFDENSMVSERKIGKIHHHFLHDIHGNLIGKVAENLAQKHELSREMQEAYVMNSYNKYLRNRAKIAKDIMPYNGLVEDEIPSKFNVFRLKSLAPIYEENGTITAATAGKIANGAACGLLHQTRRSEDDAEILGFAEYAGPSSVFIQAPIFAVSKLLNKLKLRVEDVNFFEVNEAFAITPLSFMRAFSIPEEKVNVHSGACVIGHPFGVSSLNVVINLVRALIERGGGIGIAAICINSGESVAIAIRV